MNYNDFMRRRIFLAHQVMAVAGIAMPSLMAPAFAQESNKVQSLAQALLWLDQLEAAPGVKTSGVWTLSAIFEHLSQSIEMSIDGFPQPKSGLFQATAGSIAFSVFKWRGQMSHNLSEPIPGAPTLAQQPNWRPAAQRLRAAIARFNSHNAALRPHFAYGTLSKPDFAIAHTMHIANHQNEIALHRLA